MNTRIIVCSIAFGLSLVAFPRDKKIVSFAWEWARTGPAELLELQPQIYAAGLDGIGASLWFRSGEKTFTYNDICTESWDYEAMRPEIEKYRKVLGRPGLTDCFLSSFYVPKKRFDWAFRKGSWLRWAAHRPRGLSETAAVRAPAGRPSDGRAGKDCPSPRI